MKPGTRNLTIACMLLITISYSTFAHEPAKHSHADKKNNSQHEQIKSDANTSKESTNQMLDSFPSYHPLIVHFPVVLLPVAFAIFLLGYLRNNKAWQEIAGLVFIFGLAGVLIATYWVHPHTHGMDEQMSAVLEAHERYAFITVLTASTAVALLFINFWKQSEYLKVMILISMLLASVFVSLAGHEGARLVHQMGVGPMGNYLE